MAAKKTAKSKTTKNPTIVDRFEGTIVEKPIVIANKTFLASLGLFEQARNDFEAKFEAYAKDGQKLRKQVKNETESSMSNLRNQVETRVKSTRDQIAKRVESAVSTILDYTPVATTGDIEKLNKKLDKVLVRVAK